MTTARLPMMAQLPAPPDAAAARAAQRLSDGHTSSAGWLPDGDLLGPEVARLRQEHLRRLVLASAEWNALITAVRTWEEQDEAHVEALREAARAGRRAPARGGPTNAERAEQRAELEARLWAAVEALAEVVDEIIPKLREAEDRVLEGLQADYAAAQEADAKARRELEAAVARTATEMRRITALGTWVMRAADDEVQQPAPPSTPPEIPISMFSPEADAKPEPDTGPPLELQRIKLQPWSKGYREPSDPFLEGVEQEPGALGDEEHDPAPGVNIPMSDEEIDEMRGLVA